MIEPKFEENLTIGRFYQVPTVRGQFHWILDDWPVLGPLHQDEEIIKFPDLHYHFDFRFLNTWQYKYFQELRLQPVHRWVLTEHSGVKLGPVIYRKKKCRRLMPGFPQIMGGWLTALAEAYKNHTFKDMICPHKGASLRGLPVDAEGCITCPLHGLRWHVASGKSGYSSPHNEAYPN